MNFKEKHRLFWRQCSNARPVLDDLNGMIDRVTTVLPHEFHRLRDDIPNVNSGFAHNLKLLFEASFESIKLLYQRGEIDDKLTKGELYAILFASGFPMGFIAKLLLDGNLGPIRNAVILHRTGIYSVLLRAPLGSGGMLNRVLQFQASPQIRQNDEMSESRFLKLQVAIIVTCHRFGGSSLVDKYIYLKDLSAFVDALENEDAEARSRRLNNRNLILSVLTAGFENPRRMSDILVEVGNAINLIFTEGASGARGTRRGVRRTGLTTSRASRVIQNTQLPSVESVREISQSQAAENQLETQITSAAVNPEAEVRQTRQRLVRDIPFENTTFGVEFEVVPGKGFNELELTNKLLEEFEKANLSIRAAGYTHSTTSYWKIVGDSSISPAGAEVVSPILKGKRGLTDLKKAIRAMRAAGAHVNSSVGIHVHFGAQGFELDQFKNLIFNYTGFEPIIEKILHPKRRGSGWAKSVRDKTMRVGNETLNYVQIIDRASNFRELTLNLFGNVAEATYQSYRSSGRYHAVNLYSFPQHGTIEFRQLQGSVEEDTVIYWIMWLHFLFEASKRKRLTFFDYKQVRNITPVWLSTWLGNRAYDMSGDNFDGR